MSKDLYTIRKGGFLEAEDYAKVNTIPRRELSLLLFYKLVKTKHEIVAVEFDEENHTVSFLVKAEAKKHG